MNDRQICLSVGDSRKSVSWVNEKTTVSALYTRLSQPIVSTETHTDYMNMPKAQQDALKDVGGFVGGALNGPRRKAANVVSRDIITLDFDNIPGWQSDSINARMELLNCSYCIYSTRKHTPARPRLRVVVPLDRSVSPDEYEPIARRLAQHIGIEMADKTTFDVSRLMYWPSKCADTEYYFKYADKPLLSADSILGTYADWHDTSSWPQIPGVAPYQKLAVKQGDPLTKTGTVGAFCRTYSITEAMEIFLPGIYEAVDTADDRYTYLGGSTTGGAVIYDGKFLYSHHATDPCSDKLVNAFDLVRLHKFGDLDDDVKPNTPVTKYPSFIKMCEFAEQDKRCRATLNKERQEAAAADFAGFEQSGESGNDEGEDWQLEYSKGKVAGSIDNFLKILNNDPALKGKIAYNEFAGRSEVLGPLLWNNNSERRMWTDADTNGLYWFMEKFYGVKARGEVDSALSMYLAQHSFNEVQEYINGLQWDGNKRLDALFIDYLDAEDTQYTRTVTRKMFVAAIARAMTPGCKFDNMLILVGGQGIGKSTILRKMAKGWFNDSICSFEGKEAAELLQGIWIVEVSELGAFHKSETTRIKQFLSLCSDIFRAAYARNAEERKRRCVFFGTTNATEFLRDSTGNRRFWPVDCEKLRATKDPFSDELDDIIDQLWAEAKAYWTLGEPLHLDSEMESSATAKQTEHRESSAKEGMIREFVERKVPVDWLKYSIDKRRMYWAQVNNGASATATHTNDVELVERDRITAIEIWVECLGGDKKFMKPTDTREINAVLESIPGWKKTSSVLQIGDGYGKQRCFIRN